MARIWCDGVQICDLVEHLGRPLLIVLDFCGCCVSLGHYATAFLRHLSLLLSKFFFTACTFGHLGPVWLFLRRGFFKRNPDATIIPSLVIEDFI